MAQVSIRMDDEVKRDAEALFGELGLSLSSAFNLFVRQSLRERGIPFAVKIDPFYSESNMKVLRESIAQMDDPNYPRITKTIDELVAMEK